MSKADKRRKPLPYYAGAKVDDAESYIELAVNDIRKWLSELPPGGTVSRLNSLGFNLAMALRCLTEVPREVANGNGGGGATVGDSPDNGARASATRTMGR
jgi:hypothetical protein